MNNVRGCFAPAAAVLAVLMAVVGCTRTVYLPTETARVDSVSATSVSSEAHLRELITELKNSHNVHDSIIIRDSTVIIINERGETVSREVFRERDRTRSISDIAEMIVAMYDSVYNERYEELLRLAEETQRSTIPVPVERRLTLWERLVQKTTSVVAGVIVVAAAAGVVWLAVRLRKRFPLKGS